MSSDAPLSKTAKYKKITKPLLERKRRARINRCLDELKDLMVGALEIDDDNLSKLEKADILELTVNHLTKLHSPKDPVIETKKFQAGFGQCAAEACRFIMSVPDLDTKVSQNLVSHLSRLITAQPLTIQVPDRPPFSPPTSPVSVTSDRNHYYSDQDRSSSDAEDSVYSGDAGKQWTYRQSSRTQRRSVAPIAGLLTTVDKLAAPQHAPEQLNGYSNGQRNAYFNRVPAEAKDVILQKIRQHIMDKRGNEHAPVQPSPEPRYPHADDTYRGEYSPQEYSNAYYSAAAPNDTLDLRKVRSPKKNPIDAVSTGSYNTNTSQLDVPAPAEHRVDATPSLPEHCELPMDYSNLPPKKKRKLIEYQEYKKQEEARRQLERFCAEQKVLADGPPTERDDEANKWRPW